MFNKSTIWYVPKHLAPTILLYKCNVKILKYDSLFFPFIVMYINPSEMGVQSYSWWATFLHILAPNCTSAPSWRFQATLKTLINWLGLNFAGRWPSRSRTAELYCIALPECCLQSPKLQPQALIA